MAQSEHGAMERSGASILSSLKSKISNSANGASSATTRHASSAHKRNWESAARIMQDERVDDEEVDEVLVNFLSATIPGVVYGDGAGHHVDLFGPLDVEVWAELEAEEVHFNTLSQKCARLGKAS